MRIHILIGLFILLMVDISICNARSLISSSNCIIGPQPNNSNLITIRPVSQSCYSKCDQYCLSKFKLADDSSDNGDLSQDKDSIIFKSSVFNVNKDRLEACVQSCYAGKKFDTKIRIPFRIDSNSGKSVDDDSQNPYQWKCDIKSNPAKLNDLSCNYESDDFLVDSSTTCDVNELNGFYGAQIAFKAGDKLSINVSNIVEKNSGSKNITKIVSTEENNLYLCGFKTIFFSPEYFVGNQSFKGNSSTSKIFSPRSSNRINTGIKVKDDDYLKIQYIGRYNSWCDNNKCYQRNEDYKIDIFVGGKKVDFEVSPYQMNDYDELKKKTQAKLCEQCSTDSSLPICKTPACGYYKDKSTNYGLNVNTFWLGSPELFKRQLSDKLEIYNQFRSTVLSGKIAKVTDTPQELVISYPAASTQNPNGGYFVSVEWRGCNYKNGKRLQYAIINEALYNSFKFDEYMRTGVVWKDLSMQSSNQNIYSEIDVVTADLRLPTGKDIENKFGFNSDSTVTSALPQTEKDYKGKIFFKIKGLSKGEISGLEDSDISRENAIGSYNLKVVNLSENQGPLEDIVKDFIDSLKNIPQNVFNGFVNSAQYLIIIRLLLVFYIAFTGFLFVAGMAQISQQEAVVKIFRIAVVLMLLTENSFAFFNNYLFDAFSFKSINNFANVFTPEIQMDIAPGLDSGTSNCFAEGVEIKMLCVLQKDMQLFFKWDFWNRVIGLAFSGFFIGAVAITIGIIMYAIVIFKITALYCVSLLGMTITLSLAPIFIPLVLFKYTKTFFDAWIKQLISLFLQPIFIFIAISLFRTLFIVLIKSLMGTGACKTCWLEFFTWCWVEVYVPLSLGSSPSFASMPMANIGVLLSLYFVGHGMYSFTTEVTKMGNRMISFSLFNIGSAKVGVKDMYDDAKKFGSMTYGIATAPLDALSLDDKSMDQRKGLRKARRDKENNNSN